MVISIGFLIPEELIIPVAGVDEFGWNAKIFWYEPWVSSGVHKGVDIFPSEKDQVIASTDMIKFYSGQPKTGTGGNVILVLESKWRLHCFFHLSEMNNGTMLFFPQGKEIGKVGSTGNDLGKVHLHYSIGTLLPMFCEIDSSTQGIKKHFILIQLNILANGSGGSKIQPLPRWLSIQCPDIENTPM